MDLLTQIAPEMVGQTGVSRMTVTQPLAACCIYRLVYRVDDLCDLNARHFTRELIATTWPANTGHQAATTQLGEQLLEIGKRDALPLGNIRKGYRPVLRMQRKVEHRSDGVTAFGSQSHRFAPSIMV